MAEAKLRISLTTALLVAFFLSGYAALTYEMSWVRQLVSLFGVTYHAITTILTTFMAGLALGAWLAGRLVDRRSLPPLLVFVALEVFLGVYAQLFSPLRHLVEGVYLDLVTGRDLSLAVHTGLRFVLGSLLLLPPALASGATLPAACKAFVRDERGIGRGVAGFYGLNVAGAAAGCLATTFFTIGLLGYPATAWLGTCANFSAAGLALWVHLRRHLPEVSAPVPRPWALSKEVVTVAAGYLIVGFSTISLEVLWTRCFAQFGINAATYTFGLILVCFLLGHSFGAYVLFPRLFARVEPRALFAYLVAGIGISTLFSVLALLPRVEAMHPVLALKSVGLTLPWERVWLLLPAIVLPAAFSGALFPLASHLTIRRGGEVGTGVGSLAALSTFGGIMGAFATGFWLMPALGAVRCLILVSGMGLVCATWCWSAWVAPPRRSRRVVAGGLVAMVSCVGMLLWIPPHIHLILFPGETVLVFTEGRNSSTAVVDHPGGDRFLLVHGERLLGGGSDAALLTEIHTEASRAAIIGLGTGSVVARALEQEQLDEVLAVDFDGDLPHLIPHVLGPRAEAFDSDRFRFVENDGRHFLMTTTRTFDIIVNDAALYAWYLELSTREFNEIARSRLAPGGLYAGRLHLFRITEEAFRREIATFIEVFPNAAMFGISEDIGMLVGRNGGAPVDGSGGDLGPKPRARLWYTTAQLREIAAGAEIITDAHPLHFPHTFLTEELYP
jgi:spermidine synthase